MTDFFDDQQQQLHRRPVVCRVYTADLNGEGPMTSLIRTTKQKQPSFEYKKWDLPKSKLEESVRELLLGDNKPPPPQWDVVSGTIDHRRSPEPQWAKHQKQLVEIRNEQEKMVKKFENFQLEQNFGTLAEGRKIQEKDRRQRASEKQRTAELLALNKQRGQTPSQDRGDQPPVPEGWKNSSKMTSTYREMNKWRGK